MSIPYTFIELCAGCGGLSSGLIKAGLKPILLNDQNKDCCKTLMKNHPDIKIIQGNLEDIDYKEYICKADILVGGVPCQSFSQSGKRKGLQDPRGNLMLNFIDIVHLLKPKIFIIENVKGLITHDKGNTLIKILDNIQSRNLYKTQYRCLNASKHGVPQKRERIFIIGILNTIESSFIFPQDENVIVPLKDVLYDVPESLGAKYTQQKINLFRQIPQGGCWINLPTELQMQYLGNAYHSGGGKRGYLYRLSMDKTAPTLLCVPSQKQTERCHPLEERPLTVREYARIQTFDDNYLFEGSLSSQYRQIGNAVPVELGRRLGLKIIDLLNKIKT